MEVNTLTDCEFVVGVLIDCQSLKSLQPSLRWVYLSAFKQLKVDVLNGLQWCLWWVYFLTLEELKADADANYTITEHSWRYFHSSTKFKEFFSLFNNSLALQQSLRWVYSLTFKQSWRLRYLLAVQNVSGGCTH